jgi:hypothetical protein
MTRKWSSACLHCGAPLARRDAKSFCSVVCLRQRVFSREANRFWSKVSKGQDCWEWTGKRNSHGYGQFWAAAQRQELAHRAAWRLAGNEPLGDRPLLHSCDNPACVRPDHLAPGTHLQNYHDARRRGRLPSRFGELNGRTKLRPGQADQIRERYVPGVTSLKSLATEFGISVSYVSAILRGHTWSSVRAFEPSMWVVGAGE